MQLVTYDHFFRQYADELFVDLADWRWVKAQGIAESALEPAAVSPDGAVGVMQLLPGTSRAMAGILGIEDTPLVPGVNIRMGICYLKRCWDIWKAESGVERLRFAFGSYNSDPGHIIDAQRLAAKQGLPIDEWESIVTTLPQVTGDHAAEITGYVTTIERIYRRLCEGELI